MRIGVVGSGNLGMTAVCLFVAHGHVVAVGNARGPNSMPDLVRTFGGKARAATVTELAIGAELIILALPFGRYRQLPVEPFRGKTVVDATNYLPGRDGSLVELDSDRVASSELIARHLVRARVVKAFNTMRYESLATEGRTDAPRAERSALFLAGDDMDAKVIVAELIEQLGFAAIDTGSLSQGGRMQQPGSVIYNTPLDARDAEAAVAEAAALINP
ncbi:MAG: NADPH-dependent F420 reductase [Solirubrobacteraceae bacterium]